MVDTNSVLTINESSFDEVISKGLTLVDFWAEWCMPCRMQTPIMDKLAKKTGDKVTIGKVNVDENMTVASRYGITGIPTSILFKDGEEVRRFVGVQSEEVLSKALGDNE